MNPLLSFWIKVQPLSAGFGGHTWKAVSQSSAIASSSGDDATVERTTTSSSWAFDYLMGATTHLAAQLRRASSSWLSSPMPMICRMQDAPILKPSAMALCEGLQHHPTRRVDTARLNAQHLSKSAGASPTPLLQAQQILQRQDYLNYQIPPPIARRNSKEWVRQYKKERIDKINYNNVFGVTSEAANNEIPTLPPLHPGAAAEAITSSESESLKHLIPPNSPTSSTSSTTSAMTTVADSVVSRPLSPPCPPPLSDAVAGGPFPHDVICGRGGKANTHPGNVAFREEAKKLRAWYESSSKSEKFTISSFLVDIVRERGGRFLKRDPQRTGSWLEADGTDVRKKASQSLREGRRPQ